jgi:hypothetical protein
MSVLRLVMIIGIIIAGAVFAWWLAPAKSKLLISREGPSFPLVSGFNLQRQEYEFPRDFGGEINLIIVAFQQQQQTTVNTWIPIAQEIEASFPGFIYYELPTITEMPALSRTFINEGMRAGIPDQTARERTITLYLDKESFKSALEIPDENDIYLFLVDWDGNILWRSAGEYSQEKASELIAVIKAQR